MIDEKLDLMSSEGEAEAEEAGRLKTLFYRIKSWLTGLSFRIGVIVLLCCIPLYAVSFLQFLLPIGVGVKSALWVIFFGLAKTAQYGGLTILGAKGIARLREWWKSHKSK